MASAKLRLPTKEIVDVKLPFLADYESLYNIAKKYYKTFSLKYYDEDNDLITIGSGSELEHAFTIFQEPTIILQSRDKPLERARVEEIEAKSPELVFVDAVPVLPDAEEDDVTIIEIPTPASLVESVVSEPEKLISSVKETNDDLNSLASNNADKSDDDDWDRHDGKHSCNSSLIDIVPGSIEPSEEKEMTIEDLKKLAKEFLQDEKVHDILSARFPVVLQELLVGGIRPAFRRLVKEVEKENALKLHPFYLKIKPHLTLIEATVVAQFGAVGQIISAVIAPTLKEEAPVLKKEVPLVKKIKSMPEKVRTEVEGISKSVGAIDGLFAKDDEKIPFISVPTSDPIQKKSIWSEPVEPVGENAAKESRLKTKSEPEPEPVAKEEAHIEEKSTEEDSDNEKAECGDHAPISSVEITDDKGNYSPVPTVVEPEAKEEEEVKVAAAKIVTEIINASKPDETSSHNSSVDSTPDKKSIQNARKLKQKVEHVLTLTGQGSKIKWTFEDGVPQIKFFKSTAYDTKVRAGDRLIKIGDESVINKSKSQVQEAWIEKGGSEEDTVLYFMSRNRIHPKEKYAKELRQIGNMGFEDVSLNRNLLKLKKGNLSEAIEERIRGLNH
mmetsp:Transcript_4765/g.7078  ORF Transcript_4765/g.7078 Transcript_4765/m.7078 type:complete len:612 (-) Transcript_4765:228-2063(-)